MGFVGISILFFRMLMNAKHSIGVGAEGSVGGMEDSPCCPLCGLKAPQGAQIPFACEWYLCAPSKLGEQC
ncbi:MAG: hypothetical protein IJ641_02980 [Lachnospiraceae bacterium]|nr:hypothetical protein [Lachnospiraceae bacterium]